MVCKNFSIHESNGQASITLKSALPIGLICQTSGPVQIPIQDFEFPY